MGCGCIYLENLDTMHAPPHLNLYFLCFMLKVALKGDSLRALF
jgi:hypothetical protein